MLNRLLPKTINNVFPGHPVALWMFVFLTVVTIGRSLAHILLPDGGAQSIATLPLDTYTEQGADAVILVFALWGLSQLLLGILYVIAFLRYRSLIPLLWLLVIVEYAARIIIGEFKSVETTGTAPGSVGDNILVVLGVAMLVLSLWPRQRDA